MFLFFAIKILGLYPIAEHIFAGAAARPDPLCQIQRQKRVCNREKLVDSSHLRFEFGLLQKV